MQITMHMRNTNENVESTKKIIIFKWASSEIVFIVAVAVAVFATIYSTN